MSDDFHPRKNDALVEPMFEALGSDAESTDSDGAPPPDQVATHSRPGWLGWLIGGVVIVVAARCVYALVG